MNNSNRIILNSVYIYIGVIISTFVSLFSVPILLKNLGTNDYGLYSLVAGVIAMLSFVKSSMIVTVQRFLNVAFGANDFRKANKIYSVSVLLYYTVAIVIVILIELLGPLVSEGYLNIENNRISAAIFLFQVLVISTFFTTISVPYDALFNVYEDMWLFSFFNAIESLLRLVLAIILGYIFSYDRLVVYAIGIAVIGVLIFISKCIICKRKYHEIHFVHIEKRDLSIAIEIFSFIGWNLYSTLAKMFSTQGFAVVLNLSMGTVVNAAYGIANQVNGCLQHFTSSIEKAFNPQIMKSEGMNERGRVVKMAVLSTKYCAWIYSLFAIPLLVSLQFIFSVWLKTPPDHSIVFTRIVVAASMISMLSSGISSIFYAIGIVKNYLLCLGTILIAMVFVGYGIMKSGLPVEWVVSLFIIIEFILMFVRLYYANKYVAYSINNYLKQIIWPYLKVAFPTFAAIIFIPCNNWATFIIMVIISVCLYLFVLYKWGFDERERRQAKDLLLMLKHKFNGNTTVHN